MLFYLIPQLTNRLFDVIYLLLHLGHRLYDVISSDNVAHEKTILCDFMCSSDLLICYFKSFYLFHSLTTDYSM